MMVAGIDSAPEATMQTRQRTWTPLVLTQLLVVLAVLVAGVVGAAVLPNDDDDALQVVTATRSSAAAEKTFRSTFSVGIEGAGLSITSVGELFVDTARNLQSGHIQLPGAGTIELRQVGDRSYVRVPPGHPQAGGKHWFGFTATAGASALGSQDPLEFLRLLGGADDVREVGEEQVNGVRTTHYAVDVTAKTLRDLAAQNPGAAGLPTGALQQVKDLTTDLWVDAEGLPRRVRVETAIQQVKARMSFEFLDYGKPVDVTAPPAGDVLDIGGTQQLGQLLQGFPRG
jgi:hypothetical protein